MDGASQVQPVDSTISCNDTGINDSNQHNDHLEGTVSCPPYAEVSNGYGIMDTNEEPCSGNGTTSPAIDVPPCGSAMVLSSDHLQTSKSCVLGSPSSEQGSPLMANGASGVQPAPAGEVLPPVSHQRDGIPSMSTLEAFQLGLHASNSMLGSAELPPSEGIDIIPPQGHFQSDENSMNILFHNNPINKLQTSDANISATKQHRRDLFSHKSQEFFSVDRYSTSQTPTNSSKLLESKVVLNGDILPDNDKGKNITSPSIVKDSTTVKNHISLSGDRTQSIISNLQPQMLYSRVAAPANAKPLTSGSSPECGVSIERVQGLSLETYAWAATQVTGKDTISYIGHNPTDENFVLIFFRQKELASLLVEKGLWVRYKWLNVSYFQAPATKYTISGVLPFIPDTLVIDALIPYGTSVYSVLRRIPAAVRGNIFKGLLSFRREIYIVRNEIPIPSVVHVSFLGISYSLDISDQGPKCFSCGSSNHLAIGCTSVWDRHTGLGEKDLSASGDDPSSVIQTGSKNEEERPHPKQGSSKVKEIPGLHAPQIASSSQHNIQHIKKDLYRGSLTLKPLPLQPEGKIKGQPESTKLHNQVMKDNLTPQVDKANKNTAAVIGHKGFVLEKEVLISQTNSSAISGKDQCIHPRLDRNTKSPLENSISLSTNPSKSSSMYNCLPDELAEIQPDQPLTDEESEKKKKKKRKKVRSEESPQKLLEQSSMDVDAGLMANPPVVNMDTPLSLLRPHSQIDSSTGVRPKYTDKNVFLFTGSMSGDSDSKQNVHKAKQVAKEWCDRVRTLKSNSRRKMASSFVDIYPDLQSLLNIALMDSEEYPPSSARYRKVQELIQHSKNIQAKRGSKRAPKRRQNLSP